MSDIGPNLSIVVPVYNEIDTLADFVRGLYDYLVETHGSDYEVILIENGSTDGTQALADQLPLNYAELQVIHLPYASYGNALRKGLLAASGRNVVVLNADLMDGPFITACVEQLARYDIVIGSKNLPGSEDQRPFRRRLITRSFNLFLRIAFGFRGTDTHGLKGFRGTVIRRLVSVCSTNAEIFDTELILRAQKLRLVITEVPIVVKETRPSRYGLLGRVPRTFVDIFTLWRVLREENHAKSASIRNRKTLAHDALGAKFDVSMNQYDLQRRLELVFEQIPQEIWATHPLVLDAGCGTGWFSCRARELGGRVVSLDIGMNLLRVAKMKGCPQLAAADCAKLPFADATFDVVLSSEVIEHLPDPDKGALELVRVLRPSGILILTTPNRLWLRLIYLANRLKLRPYEGFENWCSRRQLREWITQGGGEVEHIFGFHALPLIYFRPLQPLVRRLDRVQLLGPAMVGIGIVARRKEPNK